MNQEGQEESFVSHLVELRNRIIRSAVVVLVAFGVCFYFSGDIMKFLSQPLYQALPPGTRPIFTDQAGAFFTLTKVAFTQVVDDAIVEGEVMDPAIVAEAIKGLFASSGIKPKQLVTAVGGRDVIIKKISMDRMKEAEAREVIRWEAEQHVPFDMDNVELDFQILDPAGEGLQMTVLLVAAKRELVENKLSLLSEVGVEPADDGAHHLLVHVHGVPFWAWAPPGRASGGGQAWKRLWWRCPSSGMPTWISSDTTRTSNSKSWQPVGFRPLPVARSNSHRWPGHTSRPVSGSHWPSASSTSWCGHMPW